jgi:hypothetical protein
MTSITSKTELPEGAVSEYVTAMIGGSCSACRSLASRTCSCRSG